MELIPEFYEYDPSFLLNRLSVFLSPLPSSLPLFPSSSPSHGLPQVPQQLPVPLGDVELPPWPPAKFRVTPTEATDFSSEPAGQQETRPPYVTHGREKSLELTGGSGVISHSESPIFEKGDEVRNGVGGGGRGGERGDASSFLLHLREALEGTWTSKNIHNWIDLVFGYKQTGEVRLAEPGLPSLLTECLLPCLLYTKTSERNSDQIPIE